jgi:hypothetical protein
MNYTSEIIEKLRLVNEVLDKLHVPTLLDNDDFSIDEMSMESWLKVDLRVESNNKIPLSFIFTQGGLEIHLDRVSEAYDWSNKEIKKSSSSLSSMLSTLLTSYFLVEYHGSGHTKIRLFSKNGKCLNVLRYTEGLAFIGKREYQLYFPIY